MEILHDGGAYSRINRVRWRSSSRAESLVIASCLSAILASCSEGTSSVAPAAHCAIPNVDPSNSMLGLVGPPADSQDTSGSSVTLKWDASSMATGYHLYIGIRSKSYVQVADVGPVTTALVSNLAEDRTYYFVVTAYNSVGESCASNEVSADVP